MSSYLPVAKLGAQLVAGLGVSKILADVIKNNVSVVTTAQAITVKAGGFVLGSMLVEQSSKHIEQVANDVNAWFEKRNAKDEETEK